VADVCYWQHVRVDFHIKARGLGRALHHCLEAPRRKRCPALGHLVERQRWCSRSGIAAPAPRISIYMKF
jgi:hypothetical protein